MNLYVPILKWKAGEISAYKNLNSTISSYVHPLFEIPPPEYDYMKKKDSKNIDEHLETFGDRYKGNCNNKSCFIDTSLIPEEVRMKDGRLPMQFVFDAIKQRGLSAIPVAKIDQSNLITTLIKNINIRDKNGLCLRLTLDQILSSDLELKINKLLSEIEISHSNIDLLVDLKRPTNFEPIESLAKMLQMLCSKIPKLNNWRSFIISACSFPESLSEFKNTVNKVKRNEWDLYLQFIKFLPEKTRKPIFSDYGIRTPEYKKFDPTKMAAPKNKIIYTIRRRNRLGITSIGPGSVVHVSDSTWNNGRCVDINISDCPWKSLPVPGGDLNIKEKQKVGRWFMMTMRIIHKR